MARDKVEYYINYMENKQLQEFEALKRSLKQVEYYKDYYKTYSENIKKVEAVEKKEKVKKLKVIDTDIKEIIKLHKEELGEKIKKHYKNIEKRRLFLEKEELKSYYLSDQERYKLHFYGVSEELKGKYPELIAILEALDQEKREVKQCFYCGGIEPISKYQKNGKTPRGKQKYRQECRECREERRESLKEARQDQADKEKQRELEEIEALKIKEKRKREPKKQCKICGKKKPISEYQKNGKTPRGKQKYRQECRECREKLEPGEKERRKRIEIMNQETKRIEEYTEGLKGILSKIKANRG